MALAASALATAFASGVAALYVQGRSLPPTDGAYGQSVWQTLADPFVTMLFVPFALGAGLVGFVASLFLLWRVDLTRAVPVVALATITSAAIMGWVFTPGSPVISLAIGLLTMELCGHCSRWKLPPEPAARSVFRQYLDDLARDDSQRDDASA